MAGWLVGCLVGSWMVGDGWMDGWMNGRTIRVRELFRGSLLSALAWETLVTPPRSCFTFITCTGTHYILLRCLLSLLFFFSLVFASGTDWCVVCCL